MAEQGTYKITLLQRRYAQYQLTADVLFAVAIGLFVGCFGYGFYSLHWGWAVLSFLLTLTSLILIGRSRRKDTRAIATFLNLKYPQLEESSELFLKPGDELNLLEKLQLERMEAALNEIPPTQKQFTQRLRFSILLIVLAALFGEMAIYMHDAWQHGGSVASAPTTITDKNSVPEKVLPQIESVSIGITPPAYTHKPYREQDKFTLEVEEGSAVKWKLKLNVAAKQVSLLFNDDEKIRLKSSGGNSEYTAQKQIAQPGFYQVSIDGKLSDLYQVQVIRDTPPVIHIKTPQQYTYIDAGEAPKVTISASVDDDYGIANAFIYATVAKGSGEAVKFKEQRIDFAASFGTQNRHHDLQKLISLPLLNMEPGDELYFYIQAQDNHNQQSRTDVYIVALQDTAQLLSMDGLIAGVNIKPEFFRSERQIILDSQQLLKDRDSISRDAFNNRSNELGTDQKLLRLRYGKFLGEEAESDIDPSKSKDDPVGDIKNYGNAAVVLDAYTDKHDNAEDAQFFDPGVKAQLKATLTEMWKAELQLRLYKPDAALPFEYKALRLLKDLQQKSRSYVAKTAYNPSPLKMEKRLTGDLDKIIQPENHQNIKADNTKYDALKNAVGVLEQLKSGSTGTGADMHALQLANQQLSEKASAQPELYLPALNAMRRVLLAGKAGIGDVSIIEKAIQKLLPPGKPLPTVSQNSTDMGLSKGYYQNLNHK